MKRRALIALLAGFAVTIGFLAAGRGGSVPSPASEAEESPVLAAAVREVVDDPRAAAQPAPSVSEGKTVRERMDRAREHDGAVEIGGSVDRLPQRRRCPAVSSGAVVDLTVTGASCRVAAGLTAGYGGAPGSMTNHRSGGFTCLAQGLRVGCSRSTDAASVVMLLGPGGNGLEDCGQSPLGDSDELGQVRVRGLGCDEARQRIFAALRRGEPRSLDGLTCSERAVARVTTITCHAGSIAVAYTLPPSL